VRLEEIVGWVGNNLSRLWPSPHRLRSAEEDDMKTQHLAKATFSAMQPLVGIGGFALPGNAIAGENDASLTVTIQIYNYSQASPTMLIGAEREAGRALGEAGLRAVWL
jgi:hypothetical protein